jgi:hypothetical protein
MAGMCLFLAAILAASLGWTAASSSRPTVQPVAARQPQVALAGEATGAFPAQVVRGSALRLVGDTGDNTRVGTVTV